MNKTAIIAGIIIFAVDQITKLLALKLFAAGSIAVLPFFNFVLVWNRGVSFGMFSGHDHPYGALALIIVSLLIVGGLVVWLTQIAERRLSVAVCAVIAGALGNIVDRIQHGAVIDFLDFHAFGWHYPAFNIADSAIVLGIAFVLFDSIFLEPKRIKAQRHENA